MQGAQVLTLPGWRSSGPAHWQSRWERLYGDQRVEQADWEWPRRGDWMARLDEAVLQASVDSSPLLLAAHSLGCHLVAAWAAHSRLVDRVRGALLVAIPDVEREDMPPQLHNWRPVVRRRLPFASVAVLSSDDPFAGLAAAQVLAQAWGASVHEAGPRGHLNGDSGLGDWAEGRALLARL